METFGFKELTVWKKAMGLVDDVLLLTERITDSKRHFRLCEQLESAASSIPQNVAEGKGRNSKKEFIQFLYYSRGSAYEVVTLLNTFARRNWITQEELEALEKQLLEIVKMIKGLINSIQKSI